MSAVLLGAFRSVRHRPGADPSTAVLLMHDVMRELAAGAVTASTTIATWNPASATLRWVSAGAIAPILIRADGTLEELGGTHPRLGHPKFPAEVRLHSRRIAVGERIVLASDGILDRGIGDDQTFGRDGIAKAIAKASDGSAAATLRAIEDETREANPAALQDDATLIVLAPTAPAVSP